MTGIGFVKPPAEEERWVAATSEADWAAQGTAEEQAASGVLCVGNLSQGSGFSSQGVRHAGLRLVENQGEAEQSTDADFRAHRCDQSALTEALSHSGLTTPMGNTFPAICQGNEDDTRYPLTDPVCLRSFWHDLSHEMVWAPCTLGGRAVVAKAAPLLQEIWVIRVELVPAAPRLRPPPAAGPPTPTSRRRPAQERLAEHLPGGAPPTPGAICRTICAR